MNPVLRQILDTGSVTDGEAVLTLRHPEFPDRFSHVSRSTGELLQRAIREIRPTISVEVGLAYGVSTLFICDAIAQLAQPGTHIVMDPYQHGKWRGIGLKNLRTAGLDHLLEFHEEPSELCLPKLLAAGRRVDFAFIDGLHRFDQAFVEFFYVNRLLNPGGIVIFDDASRRSVNRVIRHALTYPAYEVYASTERPSPRSILGDVRSRAAALPMMKRVLRRDILYRDWDLNILGRCVALRKITEDARETHWDIDF